MHSNGLDLSILGKRLVIIMLRNDYIISMLFPDPRAVETAIAFNRQGERTATFLLATAPSAHWRMTTVPIRILVCGDF